MLSSVDWTEFLGTMTQAGAAFVGIVGGFLAARLIQIGSDRGLALAKISRLVERAEQLRADIDRDSAKLLLFHTTEMLTVILQSLPTLINSPTFRQEAERLVGLRTGHRRSAAAEMSGQHRIMLDRILDAIDKARVEAAALISAHPEVVTAEQLRSNFAGLRTLEDKVYVEVFAVLRGYGTLLGTGPREVKDHLAAGVPADAVIESDSEYPGVAEEWRAAKRELVTVLAGLADERNGLTSRERLRGLWGAIVLLVVSTATTVITPLIYMSQAPGLDLRQAVLPSVPNVSHVNLLVGLFSLVFISFMVYLVVLLKKLSVAPSTEELSGRAEKRVSSFERVDIPDLGARKPELPETAALRPSPLDGQMQNVLRGYLEGKGAVEIQNEEGDPSFVSFIWRGQDCRFTGETVISALEKAYVFVFSHAEG